MKRRLEQKVVLVSLLLFFIFNVPFLFMFNGKFGNIDMSFVYVGIVVGWLAAVGLTYKILMNGLTSG